MSGSGLMGALNADAVNVGRSLPLPSVRSSWAFRRCLLRLHRGRLRYHSYLCWIWRDSRPWTRTFHGLCFGIAAFACFGILSSYSGTISGLQIVGVFICFVMVGGNDVTFLCQLKCPFSVYDSQGVRQFQFGSFDWCAPSGSLTSTTPGEFANSSLEVLIGAPPRGVRPVRLLGSSTGTALNF